MEVNASDRTRESTVKAILPQLRGHSSAGTQHFVLGGRVGFDGAASFRSGCPRLTACVQVSICLRSVMVPFV